MRWKRMILGIILLLGFSLRLWGVQAGLPEYFYIDGVKVVNPAIKIAYSFLIKQPSLDPGYYQYPTLTTNILAGEYVLYGLIKGFYLALTERAPDFSTATRFVFLDLSGYANFVLLGRLTSVAASTLTIFILYRTALIIYNDKRVALVGAFFLVSMFLHVKNAKYSAPDAMMGLVSMGAWFFLMKIAHGGKLKDYLLAGALIGLATATKYLPIFLLLPATLATGLDFYSHPEKRRRVTMYAALACLLVPIGFFTATPSFFYHPAEYLERLNTEKKGQYEIGGKPGDVQQGYFDYLFSQSPTYNEPLAINSLMGSMGWPLLMVSLAGLVWSLREGIFNKDFSSKANLILAITCVAFYLLMAKPGQLRTVRHFYWWLPIFALLASYCLVTITTKISHRHQTLTISLIAMLIIAPTLWRTIRYDHLQSYPDNRFIASAWINENLSPGSRVFMPNLYSPTVAKNNFQIILFDRPMVNPQTLNLKTLRAYKIDYVIRNSFFEDRYFAAETQRSFPELAQSYQNFSQELAKDAQLIKEFPINNYNQPGPAIKIYRIR